MVSFCPCLGYSLWGFLIANGGCVEGGTPIPGKINPMDLPDDFFRIRLVCTLLDTCGHCFDRGSAKKKLDFFLTFFQVRPFTSLICL